MTKKASLLTDDTLFAAVDQFAQKALTEGCNPAELSCALTAIAVRIGLDLAPNAGIAFAVVMRAVSELGRAMGRIARLPGRRPHRRHHDLWNDDPLRGRI